MKERIEIEKFSPSPLNSLGMFHKMPETRKSLVLFVDINQTIIVTSSRKNNNRKEGILTLLAEHYSAIWDAEIVNEKMTFKDFVKNYLHPGNEQAQLEQYSHFFEYLKNKNHHDLLKEVLAEYEEVYQKLSQNKEDDIPSFIKLIKHLEENKNTVPYTLILRTFGRDLEKTVDELERRTPIKFTYCAQFDADGFLTIGEKIKKSSAQIQDVIKPFEHGAWQDNYTRWKKSQFIADGKLFPIDLDNENQVSVFWDDNIGDKDKKILFLKLTSGNAIVNNDKFEELLIQSQHLVRIRTREAIKNDDYFICLKDYVYKQESLKNSRELQKLIDNSHAEEFNAKISCNP